MIVASREDRVIAALIQDSRIAIRDRVLELKPGLKDVRVFIDLQVIK